MEGYLEEIKSRSKPMSGFGFASPPSRSSGTNGRPVAAATLYIRDRIGYPIRRRARPIPHSANKAFTQLCCGAEFVMPQLRELILYSAGPLRFQQATYRKQCQSVRFFAASPIVWNAVVARHGRLGVHHGGRQWRGQLADLLQVARSNEASLYRDGDGLYLQVTARAKSWVLRLGRPRSESCSPVCGDCRWELTISNSVLRDDERAAPAHVRPKGDVDRITRSDRRSVLKTCGSGDITPALKRMAEAECTALFGFFRASHVLNRH
jgi:hypothetical protein